MKNNKLLRIILKTNSILIIFGFVILFTFLGCDKKDEGGFTADFSFQYKDDNHVVFENKSDGEYYSMIWDFGNGDADTTTNKKESFEIYYPVAGDYDVSLSLLDYTGNSKSVKKSISIVSTDFQLSFTAVVDPEFPNYVTLTNISLGTFNSFSWHFRDMVIENEMEYVAYFPFAGSFAVELVAKKGSDEFSLIQNVHITQDDPDYIPNLTLVWSDEFDGSLVNTNDWTFETGASGWGNNELQNYTNGNNAEVVDGNLILTARKLNDNTTVGSYTSTRMVTKGKREFQYGKIEIRAKLPSGTGIWPAIWMLGSNFGSAGWPACGEADIMEYVGYQPNVIHSTVHTTSGSGGSGVGNSMTVSTCEEEFHIYGLLWTDEKMVFYVDIPENIVHTYNPLVKTIENWPFDQPSFFILNVAVGGTWGGAQGIDNSIFPQSMYIDYVRVYQEVK